MALDKSITHGKEKRQPYRGSKAFDSSCRNHGGCPWCERGRTHADKRRLGFDVPEDFDTMFEDEVAEMFLDDSHYSEVE